MYELKKNGKVFTSKFVGSGPSSYEKRIYRAAVSQRLRNTVLSDASSHETVGSPIPFNVKKFRAGLSKRGARLRSLRRASKCYCTQ
jgi:hypothetical protein